MTLRARLALAFLLIAVLLTLPLAIASQALGKLSAETKRMQEDAVAASLQLSQMRANIESIRNAEKAVLFVPDSGTVAWMNRSIDSLASQSESIAGAQLPLVAAMVDSIGTDLRQNAEAQIAAALRGDAPVADSVSLNHVVAALDRGTAALVEGERQISRRAQDLVVSSAEQASVARDITLLLFALGALLAALVAFWITRSISRPVRDLEEGMHAVATGHFDHRLRIADRRGDEFGRLAASYASMARQLAELDTLKAEFVSIASHELKTPINVILGYLQLLEEGVYGPLTPRQHEILATLASQGNALARLAQQLLDVSRFEAGGGKLELKPIVPRALIRELEQTFQVLSVQRSIAFEVLISPDLPSEVIWDEDRINEVMGNLLANAFKFTTPGGRVGLRAEPDGDRVLLEITDTGAGIPASQLPHVFKKFYQADNQRSAAVKGTGLGLAIAKEIVEAHGGEIIVESTPGVGTVFTIVLPARARTTRMTLTPRGTRAVAAVGTGAP